MASANPVRIEARGRFAVSPREGFDYITDPTNWPQYWPDFVRIEAGSRCAATKTVANLDRHFTEARGERR
jgi:uncharacterized protein YndB with AHSA1/START domain